MRLLIGEIMRIRKVSFYDQFSCLAGNCPDSCCKEWEVQVDPDTAKYYRSLPGQLGQRLRQVMKDDAQFGTVMINEESRCPMWRKDGLCEIQAQLGEQALCKTCREYPRLTHDYGDFVEYTLELSCPEAARLILTAPRLPMVETEQPGGNVTDYDEDLMALLLESRDTALTLLENPELTVPEALQALLLYTHHVQSLIDGGDNSPFDVRRALSTASEWVQTPDTSAFLTFFSQLELLNRDWGQRLCNPHPVPWHDGFRNFARYGIERYWLQAVSDYDLVCRGKLILSACILVRILGGDFLEAAQTYSKEVENNIDNVDAILDGAYTSPALTDTALLSLLQE